jgi:LacI family transcriptional regulator
MPVTLKDIAKQVGKSVPTVSRALGDYADISLATRREVQRVAREMGYEPSVAARNLQRKRTDAIALIMPPARHLRFSDPFFGEFISGVVERTGQHGFTLTISTDTSDDPRVLYLKQIRSRHADGFIIVRTRRQDERIALLREHKVPFVAFGRVEGLNDFSFVDEDGAAGVRQAVEHLLGLGHRRLACIAEPLTLTKSYHRVTGFWQALAANGIDRDDELFVEANFRQQSGERAAEQLLSLAEPPTAIVACNDLLALGAMNAIRKRGMEVGRDVSITGFDDIMLAEYANPGLTTVHLPAAAMGAQVADMLVQCIRSEVPTVEQVIVDPTFVQRASTGPPASA